MSVDTNEPVGRHEPCDERKPFSPVDRFDALLVGLFILLFESVSIT